MNLTTELTEQAEEHLSLPPPLSRAEQRLLGETRRTCTSLQYEDCSHQVLAIISQRYGVDFATALFYDRIRRAAHNRAFIEAIDRPAPPLRRIRGTLLIAPALFYRQRPELGGDGAVVRRSARAAGLEVELLPLSSGGTARENAAILRDGLSARCTDPTVIVSLSKGAADVRLALESMGVPPPGLRAWVIVSGLLRGTYAIDRMQARWWSRLALRFILLRTGGSSDLPNEFSTGADAPLMHSATAPAGVLVINLIGCPLTHQLGTRFGRMRHRQMSTLGPSDGLTLLRDAIVEPGLTYPLWGADHYFRVPAVPILLQRVLWYLASVGCLGIGTQE